MSEKRKDSKGRILRTGESQRTNGTYMYRYTDIYGKRQCVYAQTLADLRDKQKDITRDLDDEIDYAAGMVSVIDQVDKYLATRKKLRARTKAAYADSRKWIVRDAISGKNIRDVKRSEAKSFVIRLSDAGLSYQSVGHVKAIICPAFEMAVEDHVLRSNPFRFKLPDVIPKNTRTRNALTSTQKAEFLHFLENDNVGKRQYDVMVVLLETGMRISELCGLTLDNIDFDEKRITVSKQLLYLNHHGLYIEYPKTDSGQRFIPMTDDVCQAFRRIIDQRPKLKVEPEVDGCKGFVFLGRRGNPKRAKNFQVSFKSLVDRYNATHEEALQITPHILRHTFCSDLVADKIDIKSLQYLMGHKDLSLTLRTYAHANYERVAASMDEIVRKRAEQNEAK